MATFLQEVIYKCMNIADNINIKGDSWSESKANRQIFGIDHFP